MIERRAQLPDVVNESGILLSIELPGSRQQVIDAVRRLGLEEVIAKRRSSRYTPGERSDAWLKLKLDKQQEFVVGGYRPGPHGVDALLVGFYEGKVLEFAGKVRAGFTPHVRREVHAQLAELHTSGCPFADLPNSRTSRWGGGVTAEQMSEMRWLRPKLVAQAPSWNGRPTVTCGTQHSSASDTTGGQRTCAGKPRRRTNGPQIRHLAN